MADGTSTLTSCACGAPATANGRECPRHFRERLRSVRLGDAVTETRTKKNHYDRESVQATFGEDAQDRYWDDTKGLGAVERDERGNLVRTDYKGQTVEVSDADLAFFTDEGESDDVV